MSDDNPFTDPSVMGAAHSQQSDTPSWLAPAPPAEAPQTSQPSWLGGGGGGGEAKTMSTSADSGGFALPPEPKASEPPMDISCTKLPKEIALMRTANVLSAFLLTVLAALKLQKVGGDVAGGVIALYLFCFGCLLFFFEGHFSFIGKPIASNLGFMYRASGRAAFMILLGMLCFSKDPLPPFGWFVGIFVILSALFNAFILFKYPNYERSCRIKDLGE